MKLAAASGARPPWSIIATVAFVAVAMWSGYRGIGLLPVVIVGGSGLVALTLWLWTFRCGPVDPAVILPPFQVEFHDYTLYVFDDVFYLVERERGRLDDGKLSLNLAAHISRIFHHMRGQWRQIQHHGSIGDSRLLEAYASAVR